MTKIFFSYNHFDSDITEVYLDALVRSGVVTRDEVFCFERPGAQGTTGRVIGERVREAIGAPMAIAIISDAYLASSYCVGEFGYLRFSRSIGGGELAPILLPPLTSDTVPQFVRDVGLLEGFAAVSTLNELVSITTRTLDKHISYGVWETVRAETIARLAAIQAARPVPIAAPVELCDLPEETLRKILAIRQPRLSARERDWFYARFQQLEPQYHVPRAPVASAAIQARMERSRPIDDGVLTTLGEAFDIEIPPLTRPISAALKDAIQALVDPLTEAIFETVTAGDVVRLPQSQRARAYRRLYDYLCCEEALASREELAGSNVLLVPGARRGHVFRADDAARLARLSPNLLMILFSGGHPLYDDEQDLPFGEADALSYRFLSQYDDVPQHIALITDGRARTTAETIAHLQVHLKPLVADTGRPLTLTLVTSPYHMRRLYYLAQTAIHPALTHLIDHVQGSLTNASFDWGVIAHPQTANDFSRARYGIGLYLQELSKLYGGRATGEF